VGQQGAVLKRLGLGTVTFPHCGDHWNATCGKVTVPSVQRRFRPAFERQGAGTGVGGNGLPALLVATAARLLSAGGVVEPLAGGKVEPLALHHSALPEPPRHRSHIGVPDAILKTPEGGLEDRSGAGHHCPMSPFLIVALPIIAFAAGFHLHWALGGRLGFSVSLPQRPDGTPVMAHRLGWWRWAAAGVALGLLLLGALAVAVDRHESPLPPAMARAALILTGTAFILRALVPTPWTGFFKRIRSTRWARYDTHLYCPLFLLLGVSLIAIASGY
jgi:hypothetical protein